MRLARLCFLLAVLSFIPLRSSAKSDETVQSERLRRRAELSVRLNSIGSFAQKQVFLAELGDTTQSSHGAAGSIAGKVYGLDLSAVGTAYAEAWKADTLGMEWDKGLALIDSNFTYSIDGLSPGEYYVTVWADGYDTQYYNGASDLSGASHVAVVEDLTTGGIDFHLIRTAPGTGGISGIVRDVSDGKPVAGAVVSVWGSDFSGPYRFGKAECDSEGRYSVTGLKSGGYYAQVFADGYVWEMYEDAEDVRLAKPIRVDEPNTAAGIDFSIEKGGTLSGKVVDVSGKPYYKAVVIALTGREGMIPSPDDSTFSYEFGKIQRTGIADTNGVYVIDGLKKGAYLVVASVQTEGIFQELWYDQAPSMQEADSVAVRSGETTDGIDFRFSPPAGYGSLSGTIVDIDGRAIAGASVSIQEMSISAWDRNWRTVQTDSFGAYQSGYLRPGEYIVSCYAQMGWRSITRWWPDADAYEKAETVHLDPDGSVTGVDFRLPLRPGRSSISGTVQSSDGRLLVHASVQIQSRPLPGSGNDDLPSVWAYASTDSSGRYNVRDLSADTYTVYATHWEGDQFGQEWYNHKSGEASADPLVLQENQQASGVDFTLTVKPIYGSVAGTVRDSLTKQPIKRAYVHITPLSFGTGFRSIMVWNLQTTTDQNGQYAFERLTEGEYLISVYSNGGFAYYKNAPVPDMADTVIVEGGVRKQADVSLLLRNDGGGSISGQITSGWPWYKTGS
ncbi:MAG TPA: carboxypeptidase-like regulatory domain-containing protein, partial [bacterium]